MTVFYVLNIVCHTISVLTICSLLLSWLLMFFKKETILNRLYGGSSTTTQKGYDNMVVHHFVTLLIGVPFVIDMFQMGLNTPTKTIGLSVISVVVLVTVYSVIYIGAALITLFSSIRSKIKPT